MVKKLLATASALILFTGTVQANIAFEPVKANANQKIVGQTIQEVRGHVAIDLKYLNSADPVRVFHPNGAGQISEQFSPYDFKNVVQTDVFYISVRNNGIATLEADNLKFQASSDGKQWNYLDQKALSAIWRKYHYLNTNTITGTPDFMEQERAITAEKYVKQRGFTPSDIPPGGQINGYFAVEKITAPARLTITISNFQTGGSLDSFAFVYDVTAG